MSMLKTNNENFNDINYTEKSLHHKTYETYPEQRELSFVKVYSVFLSSNILNPINIFGAKEIKFLPQTLIF